MRPSCIGNDRVIWNSNHKYAGRIFSVPENRHFPHIDMMLRICTDGVGWGGAITLNCICTETQTQTQTDTHAHTHTSCYATGRSLGLAQWSGAIMLNCTCTGTHIHIMLRYWMFACTYTHTRHATLLEVLLHLRAHTHVMLRCWTFSCACTHTHTRCATLLDVLLHLHTHSIYTSTSFIMFTPFNGGGKTRWLMMTCWKSLCGTEGLLNHTDPVGSHCHKKFHEMAAKHFRFPQEQKWWDKSCRP